MKTELVQEFQARIVTASQNDLVVINYEMLMAELDESIEIFDTSNMGPFKHSMERATRLLNELSFNLDFSFEIAKDLMSLYIFVNKKLIEASQKISIQPLFTAQDVLSTLLVGWREANKTELKTAPLIQNGQQLYAGLTYGKGSLNETVYIDQSRGFKA